MFQSSNHFWILTQSTTVTPTCLDQNRIIMGRPKQALLANVICEMCVLSRISLLLRHQWDWGPWSIEANNDKVNRIYWFCIDVNNDKILPKCRLEWNQSLKFVIRFSPTENVSLSVLIYSVHRFCRSQMIYLFCCIVKVWHTLQSM